MPVLQYNVVGIILVLKGFINFFVEQWLKFSFTAIVLFLGMSEYGFNYCHNYFACAQQQLWPSEELNGGYKSPLPQARRTRWPRHSCTASVACCTHSVSFAFWAGRRSYVQCRALAVKQRRLVWLMRFSRRTNPRVQSNPSRRRKTLKEMISGFVWNREDFGF